MLSGKKALFEIFRSKDFLPSFAGCPRPLLPSTVLSRPRLPPRPLRPLRPLRPPPPPPPPRRSLRRHRNGGRRRRSTTKGQADKGGTAQGWMFLCTTYSLSNWFNRFLLNLLIVAALARKKRRTQSSKEPR